MGRGGRHRARLSRRGRFVIGAALVVAVAGGAVGLATWIGSRGVEPVCTRPEDLQTRRGITLTAEAMRAFRDAEQLAGQRIEVVQSYRSCREQALACRRICGNRNGCPGRCAPPGLSWHQRGLAVDVTEETLATPGVIDALQGAGWCQSSPESDPGHFSFDGCH